MAPLFASFDQSAEIVGVVYALIDWRVDFGEILQDDAAGIMIDLEYSCAGGGPDQVRKLKLNDLGHPIEIDRGKPYGSCLTLSAMITNYNLLYTNHNSQGKCVSAN